MPPAQIWKESLPTASPMEVYFLHNKMLLKLLLANHSVRSAYPLILYFHQATQSVLLNTVPDPKTCQSHEG